MLPGQNAGERARTPRKSTAVQLRRRHLRKRAVEVVGVHNQLDNSGCEVVLDGGRPTSRHDHLRHPDLGIESRGEVINRAVEVRENLLSRKALGGFEGSRHDHLDIAPIAPHELMGRQGRFPGRLIQGLSKAVVDEDEVTRELPYIPIRQHSWALESIRWQGTQPGLNRSRLLQQGLLGLQPSCCHLPDLRGDATSHVGGETTTAAGFPGRGASRDDPL